MAMTSSPRSAVARLSAVAAQTGLLLSLDGLAPEGGEPQLWVVRELQTGLTVRSGWLSQQDQATFRSLLQPIADQGWPVRASLSDKQRGLEPAVATVFPGIPHAWCQLHYLNNAAEPVAAAVEQLKVTLRQATRDRVGPLLRQEAGPDSPGVLTVTGLLPSPLAPSVTAATTTPAAQARESIVTDLLRRVRYLLTLKARPPSGLAGLEMYERLLRQEQQRVRAHRDRFRLHTRSAKQAQAQLAQLADQWALLPAGDGS